MFLLGSKTAREAPALVPDETARRWLADGLTAHASRLGSLAARSELILDPIGRVPNDLDGLFGLMCAVQEQIGQADLEFTLLEAGDGAPALPDGFLPLGDPTGQLLHAFARGTDYVMLYAPAVFRVPELLLAGVARELARLALALRGGHDPAVEPDDREGDTELGAVALGMGVWVANGAYVFDNACCGGGCGIDLRSLRAGLSLPEASYALALDGLRRGMSRRSVARHLRPTQRAAFKHSWSHARREPPVPALAAPSSAGELRPA